MRSVSMLSMRARVCMGSVWMATWSPSRDTASPPAALTAMANRATLACSPVASSMSISRGSGMGCMAWARPMSRSVSPDMADSTTTMRLPWRWLASTRRATAWILSVEPTEVPPNFCTMSAMVVFAQGERGPASGRRGGPVVPGLAGRRTAWPVGRGLRQGLQKTEQKI